MKLNQIAEYIEPELKIGDEYYEILDAPYKTCFSDVSGHWELYNIISKTEHGLVIRNENGQREISPSYYISNKRLFYVQKRSFGAKVQRLTIQESNDIKRKLYYSEQRLNDIQSLIVSLQRENSRLKSERQELKEKIKTSLAVHNTSNTIFSIDINTWINMPDNEKVFLIINSSYTVNTLLNKKQQLTEIINKTKSSKCDKIIIALLYFLAGGIYPYKSEYRRSCIRKAHKELINTLTDTVSTYGTISAIQKQILPHCTDKSRICSARKSVTKEKQSYVYCKKSKDCSAYGSTNEVTERHRLLVAEEKELPDIRDLLFNIRFSLYDLSITKTDDKVEDCEYPYRIAAYAERLPRIRSYLKCSVCGGLLYPDLGEYQPSDVYAIVYFTCPTIGHDERVYINHCYQCGIAYHTTMVIDSRECKHSEQELGIRNGKQKLCMRCGGSQNIPAGKYCPNCLSKNIKQNEFDYIECADCGHSGAQYGEVPNLKTKDNSPF